MIKRKTAFILGAGSSKSYNMPTGIELKTKIIELSDQAPKYGNIGIPDYDPNKMKEFCKTFLLSNINSVDHFLELNNKYGDYGKLAITLIIKEEELLNYEKVFSNEWFQYLYNRIISDIRDTNQFRKVIGNDLYFCTFNYDRLLDWAFAASLLNTFSDNDEVQRTFKLDGYGGILRFFNIKIDHVYGKIGNLKDNDISEDSYYDTTNYYNKILLINERKIDLSGIKDELTDKEVILFLGYGFNQDNNSLLDLSKVVEGKSSFATGFGLIPEEKIRIETEVPCCIDLGTTSYMLLRKHLE